MRPPGDDELMGIKVAYTLVVVSPDDGDDEVVDRLKDDVDGKDEHSPCPYELSAFLCRDQQASWSALPRPCASYSLGQQVES